MARNHRPRVLIVDDQPDMARSLARLLGSDAEVSTATSGREALARFEGGERYDLVLCDVMMPEMTGIQLFERLGALAPEATRAFVFTTGGVPPEMQRALDSTGAPCILKPCEARELRGLLARLKVADNP
jgi:CheY-like chemotaxis protein